MFVKNNDLIEIKIYYKQNKYKFLALTTAEINARIKSKKMAEEQIKEFNILTVNMQQLTWGIYNELQNSSSKLNANGEKYFDYRTYKEERLKRMIKSWDAKDEKGNPMLVNEANIMSLVPTIGDAIVRAYDEESFYDEETEKIRRQVYDYYSTNGKSKNISADIRRKITEVHLIERYHWLPKDIEEIPYRKMQDLFLIINQKEETDEIKINTEKAKQEAKQFASGKGKGKKVIETCRH